MAVCPLVYRIWWRLQDAAPKNAAMASDRRSQRWGSAQSVIARGRLFALSTCYRPLVTKTALPLMPNRIVAARRAPTQSPARSRRGLTAVGGWLAGGRPIIVDPQPVDCRSAFPVYQHFNSPSASRRAMRRRCSNAPPASTRDYAIGTSSTNFIGVDVHSLASCKLQ